MLSLKQFEFRKKIIFIVIFNYIRDVIKFELKFCEFFLIYFHFSKTASYRYKLDLT